MLATTQTMPSVYVTRRPTVSESHPPPPLPTIEARPTTLATEAATSAGIPWSTRSATWWTRSIWVPRLPRNEVPHTSQNEPERSASPGVASRRDTPSPGASRPSLPAAASGGGAGGGAPPPGANRGGRADPVGEPAERGRHQAVNEHEHGEGAGQERAAPAELAQQRDEEDAVRVPDAVREAERDEGDGDGAPAGPGHALARMIHERSSPVAGRGRRRAGQRQRRAGMQE